MQISSIAADRDERVSHQELDAGRRTPRPKLEAEGLLKTFVVVVLGWHIAAGMTRRGLGHPNMSWGLALRLS
jgi:hypothetical protein